MRITRRQLYKIISESLMLEVPEGFVDDAARRTKMKALAGKKFNVPSTGIPGIAKTAYPDAEFGVVTSDGRVIISDEDNNDLVKFAPSEVPPSLYDFIKGDGSGSTRQAAIKPAIAKSWEAYVKSPLTGGKEKGEKVRDGWAAVCESDSSFGDGSFKSWKSWYMKSIKDPALMATVGKRVGKQLSPEEVVKLYQGLAFMTPNLKGIEIDGGFSQADADAFNKTAEEAIAAAPEKEKENLRQKFAKAHKQIKSKFPEIKIQAPIVFKKRGKKSGEAETRQATSKVDKQMTAAEAERDAQQYVAKQDTPRLYGIGIGDTLSAAKSDARSNAVNKGATQIDKNTRVSDTSTGTQPIKNYPTSDGQFVSIIKLVPARANEGLSRGSLYRRRYYGRY